MTEKKRYKDSFRRKVWRRFLVLRPLMDGCVGLIFRTWVFLTMKFTKVDRRGPFWEYLRENRPCIVVLWHEDAFTTCFEYVWHTRHHGYRSLAMASAGRIGQLGGHLLRVFRITPVHGSRRRKGVKAVNELIGMVREDPRSVLLMADGSRGPSREARWGSIYLSRDTGLPIIALRGWCSHKIILKKTWMKLALPMPWGRRVMLSSEPLLVPADADKEKLEWCRAELERRMNEMADASVAYFKGGAEAVRPFGDPIQLSAARR